eukprot:4078721-Alexandrium_andersonii.AAC.1
MVLLSGVRAVVFSVCAATTAAATPERFLSDAKQPGVISSSKPVLIQGFSSSDCPVRELPELGTP